MTKVSAYEHFVKCAQLVMKKLRKKRKKKEREEHSGKTKEFPVVN